MNSIEIVPFQHDHLGGKATLVATRYWVERGINKSFLFCDVDKLPSRDYIRVPRYELSL